MAKDNDDEGNQKRPPSASLQKRRKDLFDSLHEEMEIAEYAKAETGQRRRKTPRAEGAVRTKKRKLLEESDLKQHAIQGDDDALPRMRGSKNAMENNVIHGSQVFADDEARGNDEDDQELDESDRCEITDEVAVEEEEGEDGDDDDDEEEAGNEEKQDQPGSQGQKRSASAAKPKKRLMYRMRNFKSAKMAERHGDALGAHARGQSLAAVRKLEQVANDAPTAPQVYSSLGLVYESLLSDSRKKRKSARHGEDEEENDDANGEKSIEQQLELAKKAYGSYHVAALLCKKDFSLWVRAGDTAKEIADLFSEAMASFDVQPEKREEFRQEKKKWIEEAKKDYLAADNQRPPGIDVPAKLAAAQMELGNLSESLVILTDLKNRPAAGNESDEGNVAVVPRSDFESSYKAWLLYADLMLRIGHECIQWNQGKQLNENYMFRRWLRKWSNSFDWKERRLQALVQALEAAAGSKCSEKLITWAKARASRAHEEGEEHCSDQRRWHVDLYETGKVPNARDDEERREGVELIWSTSSGGESSNTAAWSLESARNALLVKNKLELEAFDAETGTQCLPGGSSESQERATTRSALVASHRKSVVDLVGNYHQHIASLENGGDQSNVYDEENGDSPKATEPLPISGSCAAVCSIASELMKHCLHAELYEGSRLAGEVTSAYLKERAGLLEQRVQSNRSFAERQACVEESVLLQTEAYDEVGEDESDDGAMDALYFSDDDDIMKSPDGQLIPSLKSGMLPPELQFLYALSLIGEGGRVFLARQCIKAVEVIEGDNIDALISDPIDTEIVKDASWYAFRQDLTLPLHKTAAFALLVQVLQNSKKEIEFSDLVTPLLQNHLKSLETTGQLDIALFGGETETSKLAVPTRNRVIKLILASARMQLEHAKSIAESQETDAASSAVAVLDRVIPLLQKFWKVEKNGSIPSFCIEGLELLAGTFRFLMKLNDDDQADPLVLTKLLEVLSHLCGVVIPDPSNFETHDGDDLCEKLAGLPMKSDWQNVSHELISKRLYNLAVGSSVSNFSGWEMEEFNLDLLRGSNQKRRFAVNVSGERVSGYLSPTAEAELVDQWQQLTSLLPQLSTFDFKANVEKAKSSYWYKEVLDDIGTTSDSMSIYGEKDALPLFLTLSRLCLTSASSAESATVKGALIKLSLSVILPLSEFCLDMHLWESHIGKAAITKTSTMYDWNKLAKSVGQRDTEGGHGRTRRPRAHSTKRTEPAKTKRRPIPNMIRLPISLLLSQWNEASAPNRINNDDAKEAMRKVDDATRALRKCFTEAAIQKGCIQVALALVDLVAQDCCYSPFLCLQQAAIFASQGSKGGTSDQAFKEALPTERECTAQEALVTIGRADCLQSLHFPDEAIYLCSYVARVCRLHRDKRETDMEWNAKWRTVAICLYNLSVAIRKTRSFQVNDGNPEYWEDSVVDELKRGRMDAIALRGTLLTTPVPTATSLDFDHEEGAGESNEEDNFDDDDEVHDGGSDQGLADGDHLVGGNGDFMEMVEAGSSFAFQPDAIADASFAILQNHDDDEREIVEV